MLYPIYNINNIHYTYAEKKYYLQIVQLRFDIRIVVGKELLNRITRSSLESEEDLLLSATPASCSSLNQIG